MIRKLTLIATVAIATLVAAVAVEAGCRGCRGGGFFRGNRPVRTMFQNRQPARRIVRGVARVPLRGVRQVRQNRQAIRQQRRTVAVASVPGYAVTALPPATVVEDSYAEFTPTELPGNYMMEVPMETECTSCNQFGGCN